MAKTSQPSATHSNAEPPFGVNELRLSARLWLMAIALVLVCILGTPRAWRAYERFDAGRDYRLPYSLSKDYWLYERRLLETPSDSILVLGDSVVWGEYVAPEGTLTHFLDTQSGKTNRYINAGINGMFPLALEGLHRSYGASVTHRKVLLQCNLLWMSSPKADLSTTKEETFNHVTLVPQFSPRIPCYKADAQARIQSVLQRNVDFLGWVQHLQISYFGERNFLAWTLADDGGDPPRYTNSWRSPFSQLSQTLPESPVPDPQRGTQSSRHKAWNQTSTNRIAFDWVSPSQSLQWHAFQRLVNLLKERGNDVCVVLGPFNEALINDASRAGFRELHTTAVKWLNEQNITTVYPFPLPTNLYADASHPLTEGYRLLAEDLLADKEFRAWATGTKR